MFLGMHAQHRHSEPDASHAYSACYRLGNPRRDAAPCLPRKAWGHPAIPLRRLAVTTIVSPIHYHVLRWPNQPLECRCKRLLLEPPFGHDFSQVRLHRDTLAIRSAQECLEGLGDTKSGGTCRSETADPVFRERSLEACRRASLADHEAALAEHRVPRVDGHDFRRVPLVRPVLRGSSRSLLSTDPPPLSLWRRVPCMPSRACRLNWQSTSRGISTSRRPTASRGK